MHTPETSAPNAPRSWRRRLGAVSDASGAAAMLFCLIGAFVVIPLTFAGIDTYLAISQKTKLQDALDAATLYAARQKSTDSGEIDLAGKRSLSANLELVGASTKELLSASFTLTNDTVVGTATAKPGGFFNFCMFGWCVKPDLVAARAEVNRSLDKIEVALVLDNTGSMQGQKLAVLKQASKALLEQLEGIKETSIAVDPVRVGLVPFSMTVRPANTTSLASYTDTNARGGLPAWLDPEGRAHREGGINNDLFFDDSGTEFLDTEADRFKLMKTLGASWAGCVESRREPYDVQETPPTSGSPASYYVPFFWPDQPAPDALTRDFNDYLLDPAAGGLSKDEQLRRVGKYIVENIQNDGATFTQGSSYGGPLYLGPNAGCSALQPLIRLTADFGPLEGAIDGMNAVGETNITIGLAWGWNVLSPQGPFGDGRAYTEEHLKKIVVLMTDGENTFNGQIYGGLGYSWQGALPGSGSYTARMNTRLAELCMNMKAQGILLYTVRLEVAAGASEVLKTCATDPEQMFYDVQSADQLVGVFRDIGASIAAMRLSR
ncbi:MAG TPA: TadE/TadG family type IV pilus assembly protein [Phenylobacterium sp.]